ncbi:MAG: hypothetical protein K6F17_08785 [Lachnospiraceae bacterium]|nr:hypothetical protein [Lachnospiraceae bacterium]
MDNGYVSMGSAAKGLNYMFWGFVLVLFDFNLNGALITIDIIPDIIGWAMILYSLKYLEDFGLNKPLHRNLIIVMMVFSCIGMIRMEVSAFSMMLSFVSMIFSIIVYYELYTAAAKVATYMGNHTRARSIKSSLNAFVAIYAVTALFGGGLAIPVISLPLVIAFLVLSIVMLVHLYSVKSEAQAYSDGQ